MDLREKTPLVRDSMLSITLECFVLSIREGPYPLCVFIQTFLSSLCCVPRSNVQHVPRRDHCDLEAEGGHRLWVILQHKWAGWRADMWRHRSEGRPLSLPHLSGALLLLPISSQPSKLPACKQNCRPQGVHAGEWLVWQSGVCAGHARPVPKWWVIVWDSPDVVQGSGKERYVFMSFPHISINAAGDVGAISRPGRPGQSCACGALNGALSDIKASGLKANCKKPGGARTLLCGYSLWTSLLLLSAASRLSLHQQHRFAEAQRALP